LADEASCPSNEHLINDTWMTPLGRSIETMLKKREPAPEPKIAQSGGVTELRVSASVMSLDVGLYCVYSNASSAASDSESGLPDIRITRCPGTSSPPDAVSIVTFREDGWLDATAALVRVSKGPAQILVTVYQAAVPTGESAPGLEVLRLTGEPSSGSSTQSTSNRSEAAHDIVAHVQGAGDLSGKLGEWIGQRGAGSWIEGFSVSDNGLLGPGGIEYQAVLGRGWLSPWVGNGQFCGSRGMALPLLGINLRLKGVLSEQYTLSYSATFIGGHSAGPVPGGSICEGPGAEELEAFMIVLKPKLNDHTAERAPRATSRGTRKTVHRPVKSVTRRP
jgi:hydrophobic W protein